ncbi:MAG TPA: NADH-quinone oxidoreductase subunit C [Acidimicrobiales bacterium]|nr:NADH-quinone oxidoreductase subunit C [Acidimicrobiales bacterium]
MSAVATSARVAAGELAETVADEVRAGGRFAGLFATGRAGGSTTLRAVVARAGSLVLTEAELGPGESRYPALTPLVPAASWYEREIHDLFGIEPSGHRRLDPLVLPLRAGCHRPRPGDPAGTDRIELDVAPLPAHVRGEGVFTIPYGPVRSGVFESVEYLVETRGEEISHLRTRVYHKHRGLDRRFSELGVDDALLLAERVEGTAAVAHALAFSQAIEELAGIEPPRSAQLLRVLHAELERVAVHLDSVIRHAEGAGQAVAYARMSRHREELLRLRARLCGHRFGRGVVVPGGVTGPARAEPEQALAHVNALEAAIAEDARALMATPSFLDRLRGTGVLPRDVAAAHGALGPVGRASGQGEDVRVQRPYGAYRHLGCEPAATDAEGDALARQHVRLAEIRQAFHLARQALEELVDGASSTWRVAVPPVSGVAVASVEAPQGELLYLVEAEGGRLARVKPRSASFHNLALLPRAFGGDIFTDFVFIEASFGLSIAGVAG